LLSDVPSFDEYRRYATCQARDFLFDDKSDVVCLFGVPFFSGDIDEKDPKTVANRAHVCYTT